MEICLGPSWLLLLSQDDVYAVLWSSRSIHLLGRVSGDVLGGLLDIAGLGGVLLVGRVVPGGGSLAVLVVPGMGWMFETVRNQS